MRGPNRNDVAREAQVSGATVSRVLSGRADVAISDETRERVIKAAERLGYRLNHSARALVTGRTDLVALWMHHLQTPFHAQVAHYTAFANRPTGYRILISEMEGIGEGGVIPDIRQLTIDDVNVDGIIAHEGSDYVSAYLRSYPQQRPPIVIMGAYFLRSIDHVGVDLYAGQVEATRHLYDVGCRRIAFLVNVGSNHPGDARADGYAAAMREVGLPPEYIETPEGDQTRATARRTVDAYIRQHGHPDGILCLNDEMAIGANRALRDLGLRVPEDVCLVGYDGIEDMEYQTPPLSTMVQPLREMSEIAWQFLLKRIQEPDAPLQHAVLQPHLLIRESSQRS